MPSTAPFGLEGFEAPGTSQKSQGSFPRARGRQNRLIGLGDIHLAGMRLRLKNDLPTVQVMHAYEVRPRKGLTPNDIPAVHAVSRKDIGCAPLKPQR
jgi:hypothetical protein